MSNGGFSLSFSLIRLKKATVDDNEVVSKFAAISHAKIKDEGDIKLAANRRRRLLPRPASLGPPSATLLPRTANFTLLLPALKAPPN